MELGKFIAKVISEIKENVKDSDSIGGQRGDVELDLIVYPENENVGVFGVHSSANVSRIKIPLHIGGKETQ